jgi:hypothetical protein
MKPTIYVEAVIAETDEMKTERGPNKFSAGLLLLLFANCLKVQPHWEPNYPGDPENTQITEKVNCVM